MTDGEEAGRGHWGLGPSSSASLVIPCHIGYGPQQRDLVNFDCITSHTASTFGRTIFPGVWDVSVMRHGSQASDEIEDDLYQYNVE